MGCPCLLKVLWGSRLTAFTGSAGGIGTRAWSLTWQLERLHLAFVQMGGLQFGGTLSEHEQDID